MSGCAAYIHQAQKNHRVLIRQPAESLSPMLLRYLLFNVAISDFWYVPPKRDLCFIPT